MQGRKRDKGLSSDDWKILTQVLEGLAKMTQSALAAYNSQRAPLLAPAPTTQLRENLKPTTRILGQKDALNSQPESASIGAVIPRMSLEITVDLALHPCDNLRDRKV